MNTTKRHTIVKLGVALLLAAGLLGLAGLLQRDALAATLPAATCTLTGTTRTCELWATTGTLSLPGGASVPIWGFADTATGSAMLPGPAIIANQGETVQVILHNNLTESTALILPGQAMPPDLIGIAAGADNALSPYSFVAASPGTYLYEAGLLPNSQHQVAMGLFGALIVRSTAVPPLGFAGQAYADAATAFHDEALLVLSEIDPALNNSPDPASFDMRSYKPKYWLINGKAYPDTEEILSAAGNKALLRIINAGVDQHSLGLLGVDQEVLAVDGSPLAHSYRVAAATLGSGQTADRLVTVPASAGTAGDSRYAVYDTSLLLHNSGAAGFGGMLTFIRVPEAVPPQGIGPLTSSVLLAPNPTDGSAEVTLSASISGDNVITAAEYFIDVQGAGGTGIAMAAQDGAFDSSSEAVVATITTADLAALSAGDHTFYVHGSDGTWGAVNFAALHLDKLGPATGGLSLAPNPSDGSVEVFVSATGDDSATGGSNITAAEYFIGAPGADGTGTALAVNLASPVASLSDSIDAATMAGLSEGAHIVSVHSMDAFGWWGDYATVTLAVDQSGPTTSNVVARPNPNNGALPYSPTVYAVRVDANLLDTSSNIQRAEGYINSDPGEGLGFPLTPRDGLYNEMDEDAYAYIPLSTINALTPGTHQIYVRGQDASGNWGAAVAVQLIIDKTTPTVSNVSATPNPTGDAQSTTLTASASDGSSNIVRAEWFEGADPGKGNGTSMQAADGVFDSSTEGLTAAIDVTLWTAGDHTLSVRARDAAGNWSAAVPYVLSVVKPDAVFADSFVSGFAPWSATTGNAAVTAAAALDGDGAGLAVTMAGITPGYVTDLTPAGEPSYHARFYLNPNGALTGNNQAYTVFAGQNAAGTTIFRVQFRRQNAAGGTYQVRASALSAGAFVNTDWFNINNNAANPVEIAWASGPAASFSLYVHGGLQQTLTGLDTSAYLLDTVQLGPSVGLTGAASGTLYFDAFVSRRYTVIGP